MTPDKKKSRTYYTKIPSDGMNNGLLKILYIKFNFVYYVSLILEL